MQLQGVKQTVFDKLKKDGNKVVNVSEVQEIFNLNYINYKNRLNSLPLWIGPIHTDTQSRIFFWTNTGMYVTLLHL